MAVLSTRSRRRPWAAGERSRPGGRPPVGYGGGTRDGAHGSDDLDSFGADSCEEVPLLDVVRSIVALARLRPLGNMCWCCVASKSRCLLAALVGRVRC